MGTTGHPVGYWEMNTTEKVREWLRKQYTWDEWRVHDLAPGTKLRSNWWIALKQVRDWQGKGDAGNHQQPS